MFEVEPVLKPISLLFFRTETLYRVGITTEPLIMSLYYSLVPIKKLLLSTYYIHEACDTHNISINHDSVK